MKKTASQIADQVLEKVATSRWREAIRSGELAPSDAETLKTRMGVDPLREAQGLSKGWRGKADYHGFAPMTQVESELPIRPVEGSRVGEKQLRSVQPNVKKYKDIGPHTYMGRKPVTRHTFVPYYSGEVTDLAARLQGRRGAEAGKHIQGELTGLTAGHEGSELVELMKGIRKGRIDLNKPRTTRWANLSHFSPRVILEEVRNARMLSPQTRATMLRLRRKVELPEIALQIPTQKGTNQLQLPRHQLERYSRKIQKSPNISRMMFDPRYGSRKVRNNWLKTLRKYVSRIK